MTDSNRRPSLNDVREYFAQELRYCWTHNRFASLRCALEDCLIRCAVSEAQPARIQRRPSPAIVQDDAHELGQCDRPIGGAADSRCVGRDKGLEWEAKTPPEGCHARECI